MNQSLARHLEALLAIPSPTGMTDAAVDYVAEALHTLGLRTERTRRGALRAIWGGDRPGPARALCVHLDTLGAMVTGMGDNGRPRLAPVGTWAARFAEGARATVHSRHGQWLRGTILPLKASGHRFGTEVESQPAAWTNLELRVDADSATGIETGDMVSVDPQPEFLDNGFLVARHLDNKAGVAALLSALETMQIAGDAPPRELHLLFSVSEEVGTGAAHLVAPTVAEMVSLDIAINAPGQSAHERGVTLAAMDAGGPYDRHLTARLRTLCQAHRIPHATDVFRHYFSDGRAATAAGVDCPMALACFACDGSHGWERSHMDSLTALRDLCRAYALEPAA